ncbi:acyltransferase family protein [Leifsonia sp. SIMBA_070]|uniref:acyltransferase family protein n=1 Tax=Leifsonia sp. SIMBA_070 TaxID=3085810 RepID=UPI00397C8FBA
MSLARPIARPEPPAPAARPSSSAALSHRDSAVDLVRAACLVVVVLLHGLMVGVSAGPSGLVLENALDRWSGLAALTWVAQVMPLFFVLGGFSGYGQWMRLREGGVGYGGYLRLRVQRLLAPAAAAVAATAVLLAALSLAGVPAEVVAVAGYRASQPLWFLAVYLLCAAALPPLVAAHRRAPVITVVALGGAVAAVDALRGATGVGALGFANLAFVWLLVQQLGFWIASGDRLPAGRRGRLLVAGAALSTLLIACASGVYSFDLYADLNPPNGALVLLGVAQAALFLAARDRLRAVAARRPVAAVTGWIGARAMTIYAWHMSALLALAGLLIATGAPLPEPLSGAWWATRPLWLLAVVAGVAAVATVASRVETSPASAGRASSVPEGGIPGYRALLAAAAGAAGVVLILLAGATLAGWVGGLALMLGALRIARSHTDARTTHGGAPLSASMSRPSSDASWHTGPDDGARSAPRSRPAAPARSR